MLKKLFVYALVVMIVLSVPAAGLTQEMTLVEKTGATEKVLYGVEQTGSLVDRVNKLEKDVYGLESHDALIDKLDKVYTYTNNSSMGTPSLVLRINGVEWALSHSVTTQPAKAKLENLERSILGNSSVGSFDERIGKLVKLACSNGQMDTSLTTVNKDTLIRIKFVSSLDSRSSRVGDVVVFQAVEDVFVGNTLIIARGAQGVGKVQRVDTAKNFGRDAKLEISFETIDVIDGTVVSVLLGDKAKEETKSLAKTAGATVAGLAILGPIGIIGGAFVHGQDITIPAGAEIYIQVKQDTPIFGIITK